MARVALHGGQGKMRLHTAHSDDEECVQSGSATGFSDAEREEYPLPRPVNKQARHAFDPVTQILDKIDAELVSLTRSQGSSSTATTATDSTIVRRPGSRNGGSSLENGDELSISQLGSSSYKPSVSLQSSSNLTGSDRDTGIGSATNSYHDNSHLTNDSNCREPDVRPLEPGDTFKTHKGHRGNSHGAGHRQRSATAPEMVYLNGQHLSDDDKTKRGQEGTLTLETKRGQESTSSLEAKQVDEKFREIMQKRKAGGYTSGQRTDDDNQTIRTEDFVDKFQDTMVYSSADEAEKLRNLDDDLHSDGGSDTDTLQRKLAVLTRTPVPAHLRNKKHNQDGGGRTRPMSRPPSEERTKRRLPVACSFDSATVSRPRKGAAPGYPPIYPKPTPTASLPRPSTRSAIKISPGHGSDADSVRTEDFENSFKDMMVNPGNQTESDLDPGSHGNDPIHSKVKQLLKATAKYRINSDSSTSTTNSILKSRLRNSDRPKVDAKPKQHVRISPQPPQYNQAKGDDSDDTLCSDSEERVHSPRRFSNQIDPGGGPHNSYGLWGAFGNFYNPRWMTAANQNLNHRHVNTSQSHEDSLSKSSCSLSQSSVSSSDKEKNSHAKKHYNYENFNDIQHHILAHPSRNFSRQTSQVSSVSSLFSNNGSEIPNTSSSASRCTSTGESMFDDTDLSSNASGKYQTFRDYQYTNNIGPTRRRSSFGENFYGQPYTPKKNGCDESMKEAKKDKKPRDLIAAEDEEEEFPFSKYTFNKKKRENKSEDEQCTSSSMSQRSSSQDSIYSVGLMNQYMVLNNGNKMAKKSSTSSLASSFTTDLNMSTSVEDANSGSLDREWRNRKLSQPTPHFNHPGYFMSMNNSVDMRSYPQQNLYQYGMYNHPHMPMQPSASSVNNHQSDYMNKLGATEAMSLLPDRFLKSWLEKVFMSQQNDYMRHLMMGHPPPPPHPSHGQPLSPSAYNNLFYSEETDLPPSVSAQASQSSTPMFGRSMENIPGHVFSLGKNPLYERRQFHRSRTFSTSNGNLETQKVPGCSYRGDLNALPAHGKVQLGHVGALPLQKENSFDKLKRILQTTDTSQYRDRTAKRYSFAANHQKSLPIFLETLSEEEEERRRSRTPSFETDAINLPKRTSKMKTFLDAESMPSGHTSEHVSDSSRSSSVNIDSSLHGLDIIGMSKRPSYTFIESDDSYSTCSSSSRTDAENSCSVPRKKSMSIPSIIISPKPDSNKPDVFLSFHSSLEYSGTEVDSPEAKQKQRRSKSRPASPIHNPNCKNDEELVMHSKDSLEIAEIMSPKEKDDKQSFTATLSKIDSFASTNNENCNESSSPDVVKNTSNQLLGSDLILGDSEHLSSSSSVASPNLMSPITVIEVSKLDNQTDCLDIEETKSENANSILSNTEDKGFIEVEHSKDLSNKFKAPKCLQLKRYTKESIKHNVSSSQSGSENVFTDNIEGCENVCKTSSGQQADDESLVPLLSLSKVSTCMKMLTSKLSTLGNQNMFYLAHDQSTQIDPKEVAGQNISDVGEQSGKITWSDCVLEGGRCKVSKCHKAGLLDDSSKTTAEKAIQTDLTEQENQYVFKMFEDIITRQVRNASYRDSCVTNEEKKPIYSNTLTFVLKPIIYKSEIHIQLTNTSKRIINHLNSQTINIFNDHVNDIEGNESSANDDFQDADDFCEDDVFTNIDTHVSVKPKDSVEKRKFFSVSDVRHVNANGSTLQKQKYHSVSDLNLVVPEPVIPGDLNENGRSPYENSPGLLSADRFHYEVVHQADLDQYLKKNSIEQLSCSDHLKDKQLSMNHESTNTSNHSVISKAEKIDLSQKHGFHSAFYINLNYGQRQSCSSDCDLLEPQREKYTNDCSQFNHIQKKGHDQGDTVTDNKTCRRSMARLDIPIITHSVRGSPQADSGFSDSKSLSDGDKTMVEDIEDVCGEKAEGRKSKSLDSFHSAYLFRPVSNGVNVIHNDNNQLDVKCIPNRWKFDTIKSPPSNDQKDGLQLCATSDDCANVNETDLDQDENRCEQEKVMEQMDCRTNCCGEERNSSTDSGDAKQLVMSTRSLDFEKETSRKGILQRCKNSAFNRTFNFSCLDIMQTSFDGNESNPRCYSSANIRDNMLIESCCDKRDLDDCVVCDSDGDDFCENAEDDMKLYLDPGLLHGHKMMSSKDVCEKSETENKDIMLGEFKGQTDASLKGENQMLQSSKAIGDSSLYQVGMKYNEDTDCFDLFGRIKVLREKAKNFDSVENNIDENSVTSVPDESLIDIFEELTEDGGSLMNDDVFDMYEQVQEDFVNYEVGDGRNSKTGQDGMEGIGDDDTEKTLLEIERLYQMNDEGDELDYCDNFDVTLDEKATSDEKHTVIECSRELDEIDREIAKLDAFYGSSEYSEVHICKNCGHKVEIPCTSKSTGPIAHDFCKECSPLNLTAEFLERRRLEKIARPHYYSFS